MQFIVSSVNSSVKIRIWSSRSNIFWKVQDYFILSTFMCAASRERCPEEAVSLCALSAQKRVRIICMTFTEILKNPHRRTRVLFFLAPLSNFHRVEWLPYFDPVSGSHYTSVVQTITYQNLFQCIPHDIDKESLSLWNSRCQGTVEGCW